MLRLPAKLAGTADQHRVAGGACAHIGDGFQSDLRADARRVSDGDANTRLVGAIWCSRQCSVVEGGLSGTLLRLPGLFFLHGLVGGIVAFVGLVHVFDVMFEHQQVWPFGAM